MKLMSTDTVLRLMGHVELLLWLEVLMGKGESGSISIIITILVRWRRWLWRKRDWRNRKTLGSFSIK